ncbi:MAG: hypothetical protein Q4G70_06690 [Pseudomonadota bacterium]|nr:hypothetical protein [Pseudomonadota bacterium]
MRLNAMTNDRGWRRMTNDECFRHQSRQRDKRIKKNVAIKPRDCLYNGGRIFKHAPKSPHEQGVRIDRAIAAWLRLL